MNTKVVLLVEDNADDVELTLRSFQKHNLCHKIIVTRNGEEALNYLFARGTFERRDPAESPALVLLDLKLPKVDGLEILRRVKADERTKMIPVVVMTSSKEDRDLVESYKLGVNSYIAKPVEFEKFLEAVQQFGLYWLLVNRIPR